MPFCSSSRSDALKWDESYATANPLVIPVRPDGIRVDPPLQLPLGLDAPNRIPASFMTLRDTSTTLTLPWTTPLVQIRHRSLFFTTPSAAVAAAAERGCSRTD